jgi:ElaB/YqjD/DUF883 family membrane-anchored ribosome-binding protein
MNAVGTHLDELFDGVDDLIKRVADTENPEIRKIRAKVHASMTVAKSAFVDAATQVRPRAVAPAGDIDEHVDGYPEQDLGFALLVGVGLGVIMSMQQ